MAHKWGKNAVTKKSLRKLVEKNIRKNPNPMIDTETGLEALERVAAIAESNGVEYALVGGIAMHLYAASRPRKRITKPTGCSGNAHGRYGEEPIGYLPAAAVNGRLSDGKVFNLMPAQAASQGGIDL